jgi:hypothetical protein
LERDGVELMNRRILCTMPDSDFFHHEFKDVGVEGRSIVVRRRLGTKPLYKVPLSRFATRRRRPRGERDRDRRKRGIAIAKKAGT